MNTQAKDKFESLFDSRYYQDYTSTFENIKIEFNKLYSILGHNSFITTLKIIIM